MSFKLTDNTRETTTTTGTGPFALAGAVAGSQAFSTAGFVIGDTFWGTIRLSGSSWVTGLMTYSATNEVTVTTPYEGSSGAGVAVSFAAGTKDVFVDFPASQAILLFLGVAAGLTPGVFSTGDLKPTHKVAADSGWILWSDGTIGGASSSASIRANADTSALFTLYYDNYTASECLLTTSAGGATTRGAQGTAAAAFAANCRLAVPKGLGRSLAIAGAGSGLTSRTLGATAGSETETPTQAKTAAHTHTVPGSSGAGANANVSGGDNLGSAATTSSIGSGSALNILDPSTYINIMIKL